MTRTTCVRALLAAATLSAAFGFDRKKNHAMPIPTSARIDDVAMSVSSSDVLFGSA